MSPRSAVLWADDRLGEALPALARAAGIPFSPVDPAAISGTAGSRHDCDAWLQWAAERQGLEVQGVDAELAEVSSLLRAVGPALIRIDNGEVAGWLLLLKARFGKLIVVRTDLRLHRLPLAVVREWLCARYEMPLIEEIDGLLERAGIPDGRRKRARSALLAERLQDLRLGNCWLLRLPPSAGVWRQLAFNGLPLQLLAAAAIYALLYAFEILGWALIGHAALAGRLDMGWFWAWVALIVTLVPLEMLGSWITSSFALNAGRLLKLRLMAGALALDPQAMKTQGAGQLLSQVIESQALESLTLNGGLSVLTAVVELAFGGWVLSLGTSGGGLIMFLIAWMAFTACLAWRYYRSLAAWSDRRLELTHGLVERMVGHRTCLAQERADRRDAMQDRELDGYLGAAADMDSARAAMTAVIGRGWLLLGVAGLGPAYIAGAAEPEMVAVALGGILLAARAFNRIATGFAALARAAVVWKRVAPLFRAASSSESAAAMPLGAAEACKAGSVLLQSNGVGFRYRSGGEPVLKGGAFLMRRGEKWLLQGASGGGKSTFASLLVGLRRPTSGLLLLDGLDHPTLGTAWRRKTVCAPQFHENHVLGGTFAFNLLMGRRWPATRADLEEAEALCRKLGLGELLDRMPGGMMQMVGETGWQLSHGERSRLYLARALLQKADLTVLDESFAALDPENLEQCLHCALEEADSLIVIAHP